MFSTRLPASLTHSPLAAAMAAQRQAGKIRADFTLSNPTVAGFSYPETLAGAWSNAATLEYTPASLGMIAAREAVAGAYADDPTLSADHVVLTASTSEGYAYLFKLLCNAGDRVMAPAPSYPLLDHLAALDAVELDRYALHDAGAWTIDLEALEKGLTPRTRAIVVVAPNNPTGSVPTPAEWAALVDVCARHRLVLIVDEVFAPYRFDGHPGDGPGVPMPVGSPVVTVRLNGLSKLVGLPQAKLAWMIVDGPARLVREALDRLEVIADTYLSVSTPVQVALPILLADGQVVRHQIRSRLVRNLDALTRSAASRDLVSLRRPQGGWTAVLRTPGVDDAEGLVRALLDEGVLTHPAYFYEFAHDGYLVVSLLTPPDDFDRGLECLSSVLAAGLTT